MVTWHDLKKNSEIATSLLSI